MTIISFLCLLIFLAFLLSGFRKNADFLSPGRIFGMLWSLVIGLVEFKLSRLQNEWTGFDWFMVVLGLFTFLIGIYISYVIHLDKPFLHVSVIREKIRNTQIDEPRLFAFIIIWFLICFFSFIAEWQIRGFLPIFSSDPGRARIEFGVFGLHYIVNSINVVLFLIIQYFIFVEKKFQKKFILIIVFILSMGNFILVLHRYGFFLLLMMAFCLFYYSGKKIGLRTYLVFGLIVIGVIIGIQNLRTNELIRGYIIYESKMKMSTSYAEFVIPYMYISMNLENFVKYYTHIVNHSNGFLTFEFLTNAVGLSKWISEYFDFEKFRLYIGGYNTYPFYWAYFYDFGITGLAVIPFIIGFIISEIFYFLHRNPNLIILVLYSIGFSVLVISYSSDPLTRFDMMVNFIIIVFAQFLFLKKETIK